MSTSVKVAVGLVGAFLLVVVGLLMMNAVGGDDPTAAAPPASEGETRLVRADGHVLGEMGSSDVTFVEFLDFECPACGQAYPFIEQLREDYAGDVTFVARHFPLDGHYNGERASRAVEAAAQQGKFEEMYHRMYETQQQWAGQQVPLDDLFRSFAEELGLDMDAYDEAYADPTTLERVKADQSDGIALGVQGTPSFFVNGEQIEPRTYKDFTDALDAALDS